MDNLIVTAEVKNLDAVTDFVLQRPEIAACPKNTQLQLRLAVEEVFVNIASYAYSEPGGFVTIRRSGGEGPEGLTLTFIDGGVPYDPLQRPDPDLTLTAEERPIGGLGVFLVKKIVDEAHYKYEDGKNILTVRKVIDGN